MIFLICPVRAFLFPDGTPKPDELLRPKKKVEKAAIVAYVAKLESEGAKVYWPMRDTDQTDPHGWDICSKNFLAILGADEIHVWYDPASTGFDLGIVFALFRIGFFKWKVIIANPEGVHPTTLKSFDNVLLKLQETSLQVYQSK